MLDRAYSMLECKELNEERRSFRGMATTPTPDRVGDVVDPMGVKAAAVIPLLLFHDHKMPVGHVRFEKATSKGIPFEATIPHVAEAGRLRDRVDEAWQMVKYKMITGVSVGFMPNRQKSARLDSGGTLYKEARGLRSRFAQNYENIGLIYDLINKKRGSSDDIIAPENVFRKTILDAPVQDVRQVRRVLQTAGPEGQQAFNELRGATVRYLRDEATKNVNRDTRGNEIVSAARMHQAISNLDKSGKLDLIFGKKGAEQMRALNEIAKDVYTSPPGAVNTSNTASVLLAAMDMAISGAGGLPLPVMSGLRLLTANIKDRRVQKQVNEALGIVKEPTVKKPVQAPSRTTNRTVH